jgi:O-antigen ligase
LGLWALAVFQILPLPEAFHRLIAPGSAAVWYPDVEAATAILGPGPHSVSLFPDATGRWLALSTGVVGLALVAAPALRERRLLFRSAVAAVAGATVVAVYGLAAQVAFGDRLYGTWTVPTIAPFGPFVSKNHFAGYVEMAALLALGLAAGLADEARRGAGWLGWIESRRSKWVVVAWGAAFALILSVPVSLSRGGVVSLCAGFLAFLGLRLRVRRSLLGSPIGLVVALAVVLFSGAAIFMVLPVEARARLGTLGDTRGDASTAYRLRLWRDALRLVASSPVVGSGFGAFGDALPRFKTAAGDLRIEHAENDWLELAAEGGLAGAVLVGILVVLTVGYGVSG